MVLFSFYLTFCDWIPIVIYLKIHIFRLTTQPAKSEFRCLKCMDAHAFFNFSTMHF